MRIIKIISITLLLFQQSCGYKIVNNLENYKFQIISYELIGDSKINNLIERNLKRFENKENAIRKFKLKANSQSTRTIMSKDSAGNALSFKTKIIVEISIFENNIFVDEIIFTKDTNYDDLSSKFELSQYEKILKRDLVDQINSELNNFLSSIK